jgi:hypothetical protein
VHHTFSLGKLASQAETSRPFWPRTTETQRPPWGGGVLVRKAAAPAQELSLHGEPEFASPNTSRQFMPSPSLSRYLSRPPRREPSCTMLMYRHRGPACSLQPISPKESVICTPHGSSPPHLPPWTAGVQQISFSVALRASRRKASVRRRFQLRSCVQTRTVLLFQLAPHPLKLPARY